MTEPQNVAIEVVASIQSAMAWMDCPFMLDDIRSHVRGAAGAELDPIKAKAWDAILEAFEAKIDATYT